MRESILKVALSVVLLAGSMCPVVWASTDPNSDFRTQQPWWQRAVFYELYPRSFNDSDGDGTGDIAGITAKLDYLKSIGVGAIWITPCFPSPQIDFGYDISDYCAIAPEYGTMADFDTMLKEAKKRNIKIVLDFVMNHTSDQHAWFKESASSNTNPKRDWFIWRSGKSGSPPNNWQALFGHSAWQLDPKTDEYFYHFFYPQQPDLNWRNPAVRTAMYDAAKFWLDKGVAGFRLDAVNTLFEEPGLKDNPIKSANKNRFGDADMENKYNYLLPELHDALKELRVVTDKYPEQRVLIGETTDSRSIKDLSRMYGLNHDEIQLPMNFMFANIDKMSAPDFRKQITAADSNPAGGWPVFLFSNHDITRAYDRYGDGKNNDAIARILGAMLYTLRGTPILYYGEEIGMPNSDPKRVEDVKDPIGKLGWPKEKGRDGERTPMQWDASKNAGFTTGEPWLPPGPSYLERNVAAESSDANSVLSFYRSLAKLRTHHPALTSGRFTALNQTDPNVLTYVRSTPYDKVFVALNMSAREQARTVDMNIEGVVHKELTSLLSTPGAVVSQSQKLLLPPYSVFIAQLK